MKTSELYRFGIATKAIIFNNKKQIFLLKKSEKDEVNPNTFDIPGGRIIFGEMPEETLIRETKEETGFHIIPITILDVWTFTKDNFQLVGISYLCELIGGEFKLSEEHVDGFWISYNDVITQKDFPEWLVKSVKKAEKIYNRQ